MTVADTDTVSEPAAVSDRHRAAVSETGTMSQSSTVSERQTSVSKTGIAETVRRVQGRGGAISMGHYRRGGITVGVGGRGGDSMTDGISRRYGDITVSVACN